MHTHRFVLCSTDILIKHSIKDPAVTVLPYSVWAARAKYRSWVIIKNRNVLLTGLKAGSSRSV